MKRFNWLLAAGVAFLASGAPAIVAASGTSDTDNLTTASDGFVVADGGSTTAGSIAEVEVTAGTLALVAVPNLQYQATSVAALTTASGNRTLTWTGGAVANGSDGWDGNNDNQIKVADTRGTLAGWTLTAGIAPFYNGKTTLAIQNIALNGTAAGDNTSQTTVSGADFASGDAAVVKAAAGAGTGDTTVTVTDAPLTLAPNVLATPGVYRTSIAWTLSAIPQP